jgi:phage gpG-like protein
MAISFKVFQDELTVLASELKGLEQQILPAIAQTMKTETQRNLLTSTDAYGVKFPPLKDPEDQGRRPLLKTFALFNAIQAYVLGNAAVCVCKVEYAGAHNEGALVRKAENRRAPPQKPWVFQKDGKTIFTYRIKAHSFIIPRRKFMGIGERLVESIKERILKFLDVRSRILQ